MSIMYELGDGYVRPKVRSVGDGAVLSDTPGGGERTIKKSFDEVSNLPDTGSVLQHDPVHTPDHYRRHPSGVECIQITQHMNFCLGNAIKYIWRADLKEDAIEDLKKAKKYIDFEIGRRLAEGTK